MAPDPRSVLRDVKALGPWAPLRLGYEASKRLGGHSLIFPRLRAEAVAVVPTDIGTHDAPAEALERLRTRVERIVAGEVELFETVVQLGMPTRWHSRVETDEEWATSYWWELDVRAGGTPTDPKWTWELGRLEHLVFLARAASVDGGSSLDTLSMQLTSWFDENPFEYGFHWYSNLEIAIRLVRWTEIVNLVGARLDPDLLARLEAEVAHAVAHLVTELPYTISSMRNNHLLGDALGLLAADEMTAPAHRRDRVTSLADRQFDQQLERHLRSDGSMVENSLSYHRFVLDMLALRLILDPDHSSARRGLVDGSQYLARLGVFDGPVPEFGDWDGGRVLVSGDDRHDLRGIAALGLSLGGTGARVDWRRSFDECAFYVGDGTPVPPEPDERDGHDVGGGMARAKRGPYTAWLKFGLGPSHQHADAGSVFVSHEGQMVVTDPGTGTYNGDQVLRDELRTTTAHPTLQLDGVDQLEPTRTFRWGNVAAGGVGEPVSVGERIVMWGAHDAYTRLDRPSRVARAVLVGSTGIVVIDWVENGGGHQALLTVPLDPDVDLDSATFDIGLVGGEFERSNMRWSRTLGHQQPTDVLRASVDAAAPMIWYLTDGTEPAVVVDGSTVTVDGISFEMDFDPTGSSLIVGQGELVERRRLDDADMFSSKGV